MSPPNLAGRSLFLVADVDALFSETEVRDAVTPWIEERRDEIGLIYWHDGPSSELQERVAERDLPRPDAVISEAGSCIQAGSRLHRVRAVEEALLTDWPGRKALSAALPKMKSLKPLRTGGKLRLPLSIEGSKGALPEDVAEVERVARSLKSRLRPTADGLEVVPLAQNPASALMTLLPALGVTPRAAKLRLVLFPRTDLQSNAMYLGFRAIVGPAGGEIARRRARTAPRTVSVTHEGSAGFFEGLERHFGWTRDAALSAPAD